MDSLCNENHILGRFFHKIYGFISTSNQANKEIACFVLNRITMHRTFHICT